MIIDVSEQHQNSVPEEHSEQQPNTAPQEPSATNPRAARTPRGKERLDLLLVTRGLAESREQARRLIMAGEVLPFHSIYVFMAIGFGAMFLSWMNDSGFWVVCKMGGLTEGETFKSWTMCLVVMGVAGLPIIWTLTKLVPLM